ncbi:DUF6286 domain-containing protein [Rhodococcus sp. G-MC3]|uniref:DUF6286 domain-containing Asp23/Gls24 family envelope stress response protein n=1 Tax=Rhodococcus sp. G-MC3 TaxID=3046209 RepID=UPI0024BA7C93|nr:DUF6286 domain-containing Asp23/Gls24 family envelope stress response protein [Rhodococcus sp. G-MC3]MDJ0392235.1 DUF6286 domain-containing protein [Rhodococcus sp. G-MC3]
MVDSAGVDTAGVDSAGVDTAGVDNGGPGTLVIKERAIERVAVTAALTVPAVVRTVGGISRLTGRELPRADVSVGEHSVSINLYVSVAWPSTISDVAASVHAEVARALGAIIGLPLHRLNVVIAATTPSTAGTHHVSGQGAAPAPRPRPPTASPAALPVALVLALALLGVAFVAGREFLIARETIVGAPWIGNAVDWIAQLHWATWMIPAAAGAVIAGLLLVAIGLKPRTKTHTGAMSATSPSPMVWLRPTDVARLCSDHAGDVQGADSARTTVTKKHVTIEVRKTRDADEAAMTESVRDAVAPTLAALADTRKTRIRIRQARS